MNMLTLPVSTIEKVERKLKSALEELSDLKKGQVKKRSQPKKPIKFWTKQQWEEAEIEADEDIKAGRVSGPFNNAEELIESLHKEAGF